MDHLREDIISIIKSGIHLEFSDHEALTNPAKFKGTLKVVDAHLDIVADKILDLFKS